MSQYFTDESKEYRIVVCARTYECNADQYQDSDFSEEITYRADEKNQVVANKVQDAVKDLNEGSAKEAVTNAKNEIATAFANDKNALQIAMLSNTDTQKAVEKLDDLYRIKQNITINTAEVDVDGLEKSKISMVGAALNASPETEIQMEIKKPDPEKDEVSKKQDWFKQNYENAIQFSMKVTGIQNSENLAIPITITMPVPNGIDADKMVVIHVQSNGNYQEEVVRNNGNGTISFTVTHFSEFVFAQKKDTASDSIVIPGGNTSSSTVSESGSSTSSKVGVAAKTQNVPMSGNVKGWGAISNEINAALVNKVQGVPAVVSISLNGTSEIPVTVLQQIVGKDLIVSFTTAHDVIINISGNSLGETLTGAASIATVADKEGNTNLQIRNIAADISKSIVILQKAKPGMKEATLYFVDADGTLIPFRKSIVYENGYVAFETPFVNANYVIK